MKGWLCGGLADIIDKSDERFWVPAWCYDSKPCFKNGRNTPWNHENPIRNANTHFPTSSSIFGCETKPASTLQNHPIYRLVIEPLYLYQSKSPQTSPRTANSPNRAFPFTNGQNLTRYSGSHHHLQHIRSILRGTNSLLLLLLLLRLFLYDVGLGPQGSLA